MPREIWIYLVLLLWVLCSVFLFSGITCKYGNRIDFLNSQNISAAMNVPEPLFNDEYIFDNEERPTQSLFFRESLPPHIRSAILSKIHSVSLVISHCDHPLSWLQNFTNGYENITSKIWIFTKCGKEVIDAPQKAEIIALPNVGRCDHTYAYWMNGSYLEANPIGSPYEIIVFLKDTDYFFHTRKTDGQEFGDLISLAVANGLGCKRWDINLFAYDKLRWVDCAKDKSDQEYRRRDGADYGEAVPFFNSNFPNLGVWADHVQLHPAAITQNIVPVCCGGVFAVTRHQIAKHPKRVWRAIAESLSRGDNIIEGHYAERLWASLLSKPLSNETATAVWGMNPIVDWDPCNLRGRLKPPPML